MKQFSKLRLWAVMRLSPALAILFSLLIYSCRKDSKLPATAAQPSSYDISEYQAIYNQAIKSAKLMSADNTMFNLIHGSVVDWNKNIIFRRPDSSLVAEFSVKSDSSLIRYKPLGAGDTAKFANKTDAVFIKFANGKRLNFYMKVIEDVGADNGKPLINDVHYTSIPSGFTGMIYYFTFDRKLINGYLYKKGILAGNSSINSTKPAPSSQETLSTKPGLKKNLIQTCATYPISIDACVTGYNYNIDENNVIHSVSWMDCNSQVVGFATVCQYTEGGGGGGGGGGTIDDPNYNPGIPCPPGGGVTVSSVVALNSHRVSPMLRPGDGGGSGGGGGSPCTITGPGSTAPDFGEDDPSQCFNCRIKEDNFDDFTEWYQQHGYTATSPYYRSVVRNGVTYMGWITDFVNNETGKVVGGYFTPEVASDQFEMGIYYSIGYDPAADVEPPSASDYSFGNPYLSAPGATINYQPPTSSAGAPLSPAQRAALEAADDARLLQLLKQEDDADDMAPSPCHGTNRSGNVKWNGTLEHWLIQVDYLATTAGAYKEYYVPGASSTGSGNAGYADIANTASSEMFEIKPNNLPGQTAGANEIHIYVTQGNLNCPPVNGIPWHGGSNYTTRYLLDPRNPNSVIRSMLFSNGVIVYDSQPRSSVPAPSPVILPQNLADKLKILLQQIALSPATMQVQIEHFLRQNPQIVPYLKTAAVGVVIGTILEDIATEGVGIADDWESFVVARTLWRIANGITIY